MPHFSTTPPDPGSGHGLRLRRTPGPGSLTAIVTCPDLVGCPTHYHQRRTVPCESPDCEPCRAGVSWRWHGYLSAIDRNTSEHFLFEMTAQAAEPFTVYLERHHSLVGCLFQATRLGTHHNGRVLIQCKRIDLTTVHLPKPPDLVKALCQIWNIPTPEVKIDGRMKLHERLNIMKKAPGNDVPVESLPPAT